MGRINDGPRMIYNNGPIRYILIWPPPRENKSQSLLNITSNLCALQQQQHPFHSSPRYLFTPIRPGTSNLNFITPPRPPSTICCSKNNLWAILLACPVCGGVGGVEHRGKLICSSTELGISTAARRQRRLFKTPP